MEGVATTRSLPEFSACEGDWSCQVSSDAYLPEPFDNHPVHHGWCHKEGIILSIETLNPKHQRNKAQFAGELPNVDACAACVLVAAKWNPDPGTADNLISLRGFKLVFWAARFRKLNVKFSKGGSFCCKFYVKFTESIRHSRRPKRQLEPP
ncbi:hypothetical protein CROQUDRAFT_100731 [Cronartium quercuum f. sp. fusiforme G11]|uniref:Uncharacterized protein n=1 Tax=Cronartium quercuum f. sp. fusiforme G11 TaxID=708437 RepID=A0A9P6N5Y3_9BASI|nr:hypothetical protein CROQUDRAFT_100731 [Cronartium quercuum f. sp. fusiforme G11]